MSVIAWVDGPPDWNPNHDTTPKYEPAPIVPIRPECQNEVNWWDKVFCNTEYDLYQKYKKTIEGGAISGLATSTGKIEK